MRKFIIMPCFITNFFALAGSYHVSNKYNGVPLLPQIIFVPIKWVAFDY